MQSEQALNDAPRVGWWKQVDPALRWALSVYLVARLLASVWAAVAFSLAPVDVPYVGHHAYETIHRAYPHDIPWLNLVLGVWFRWDTGWFTKVALDGYWPDDGSVTVSPLYPLSIRLLGGLLGGEYLLAALLISSTALVIGLTFLYKLVCLDFPEWVARRAVVYQVALPAGFFLLAGYTEAVYLCLVILTLYMARKSDWVLAGVAAFLTALARMQGWVLVFPLAYEVLRQAGWRPLHAWPGLLAAMAGPLGTLSYNLYLALAGLPAMGAVYRNDWFVQFAPPWTSVALAIEALFTGQSNFQDVINTLTFFLSVGLILVSVRKMRPTYWIYTAISQAIFLMGVVGDEQLHSMMRYVLVLFPNVIALALVTRRRWVCSGVTAGFLLLHLVLLGLFIRWVWVA
jgi:Gpi18-like mannosyltransferase